MGYKEDLLIDESHLDDDWKAQPVLYQRYSEMLADAESKRDEVKRELEVLRSQKYLNFRMEGDKKPTEAMLTALVDSDEEVIEKQKEYEQFRYEAKVMSGVVEAFSHRKKALEKMVDLFIFGWNAEPKVGRVDQIREKKRQRREMGEGDED